MKKQATVIIIILIILQLYAIVTINTLQKEIAHTKNAISSVQKQFDIQIDALYDHIEETLSPIHHTDLTVGQLDIDTLTVPITFTVVPKTVTDTLAVFLDFDGEPIALEKSGLQYHLTKSCAIDQHLSPQIILEDQGEKHITTHQGLYLSQVKDRLFPYISARFFGESSFGSNEYRAKGSLDIDYKPAPADNPFIAMTYILKADDVIIKELPITLHQDGKTGESLHIPIDERHTLAKDQVITGTLVATDSLGFIHEYHVLHWVAGSQMQREPYFKELQISAPNGDIIYLFDESAYVPVR